MLGIFYTHTLTNFFPRKYLIRQLVSARIKFCYNLHCKNNSTIGCTSDYPKQNEKLCPTTRKEEELLNIECKTAVVVGGTEGIGYAVVRELLNKKAKVVAIFGNDICKGMEVSHTLNCRFGKRKVAFYKVDVNSTSDVDCALCRVNEEFGKIDAFINTFGICDGKNWNKELTTNLVGMARTTILAHENLSESKNGGVIVNIAGIFGLLPCPGSPTISAAQHGIIGLSTSFGRDVLYKHTKIRVITLCPGMTKSTELLRNAEKRALTPFMGKCLKEQIEPMKPQRAEVCGQTIVWLVRYADSGTLWLLDGNKLFKIRVETCNPHYRSEFHHEFPA